MAFSERSFWGARKTAEPFSGFKSVAALIPWAEHTALYCFVPWDVRERSVGPEKPNLCRFELALGDRQFALWPGLTHPWHHCKPRCTDLFLTESQNRHQLLAGQQPAR